MVKIMFSFRMFLACYEHNLHKKKTLHQLCSRRITDHLIAINVDDVEAL